MDDYSYLIAVCHYDSAMDVSEVDQFGFVDLREALVNGSIPSDLSAQEGRFNNVDNPSMMRPRPSDIFEGIGAQKNYAKIVKNQREFTRKGNEA